MNLMRWKDKVAIITGAGAGIGEAIAVRFAKRALQLVLNDLRDTPSLAGPLPSSSATCARKVGRELAQRRWNGWPHRYRGQ